MPQRRIREKKRDLVRKDTHARALRHVAKLLGGIPVLARRLSVLPGVIDSWIKGSSAMPDATFLRVVDILLGYSSRLHHY